MRLHEFSFRGFTPTQSQTRQLAAVSSKLPFPRGKSGVHGKRRISLHIPANAANCTKIPPSGEDRASDDMRRETRDLVPPRPRPYSIVTGQEPAPFTVAVP